MVNGACLERHQLPEVRPFTIHHSRLQAPPRPPQPNRLPFPSMYLQDTGSTFGDRLQESLAQVFGDIVPALLGALVILFAGYLLAKVLEKLVERFLRRIRLNKMLEKGGVMQAVERSGSHLNPTRARARPPCSAPADAPMRPPTKPPSTMPTRMITMAAITLGM